MSKKSIAFIATIIILSVGYYFIAYRPADSSYTQMKNNVSYILSTSEGLNEFPNFQSRSFDNFASEYNQITNELNTLRDAVDESTVVSRDHVVRSVYNSKKKAIATYVDKVNQFNDSLQTYVFVADACNDDINNLSTNMAKDDFITTITGCQQALESESSTPDGTFDEFYQQYHDNTQILIDLYYAYYAAQSNSNVSDITKYTTYITNAKTLFTEQTSTSIIANPSISAPTTELQELESVIGKQSSALLKW